jgi:hypothetical protein
MTLEELRCMRARDTLALIEGQGAPRAALPHRRRDATAASPEDGEHGAMCAARELEWLFPELALEEQPPMRSDTAPHLAFGVASPFMPSLLVVIYTARYFLASSSKSLAATRDVHTVYGALQAVELPYARGIGMDPR